MFSEAPQQNPSNTSLAAAAALTPIIQDLAQLATPADFQRLKADLLLRAAQRDLWDLVETNPVPHRLEIPSLSAETRTEYFRSNSFRRWVEAEKEFGNRVLWVTDLDKAMASGDSFVYFFDWRARNNNFSPEQNLVMKKFLWQHGGLEDWELDALESTSGKENARKILELWRNHEIYHEAGIDLLTFWREIYWPTLTGLTPEQKAQMVAAFCGEYKTKIFPQVIDANHALREAGVDVVIVSNGDQEIAQGIAPLLGIDPVNVAGAEAEYVDGKATGKAHFLEITDKEWQGRPDPGKFVRFGCWAQRPAVTARGIDGSSLVIAGFDGDSPGPDGGAMLFMRPALVYCMIDTPGEHDQGRIRKFKAFVDTYSHWLSELFVAVTYAEPEDGPFPAEWD